MTNIRCNYPRNYRIVLIIVDEWLGVAFSLSAWQDGPGFLENFPEKNWYLLSLSLFSKILRSENYDARRKWRKTTDKQ